MVFRGGQAAKHQEAICRAGYRHATLSSMVAGEDPELSPDKAVEVLLELWRGARSRVDQRRGLEWKLSFAIWGVFTAFVALVVREQVKDDLTFPVLSLGLLATVLHALYLFGHVRTRNARDRETAVQYETILRRRCGELPPNQTVNDNRTSYFSLLFQAGVTLLLTLFACVIVRQ